MTADNYLFLRKKVWGLLRRMWLAILSRGGWSAETDYWHTDPMWDGEDAPDISTAGSTQDDSDISAAHKNLEVAVAAIKGARRLLEDISEQRAEDADTLLGRYLNAVDAAAGISDGPDAAGAITNKGHQMGVAAAVRTTTPITAPDPAQARSQAHFLQLQTMHADAMKAEEGYKKVYEAVMRSKRIEEILGQLRPATG